MRQQHLQPHQYRDLPRAPGETRGIQEAPSRGIRLSHEDEYQKYYYTLRQYDRWIAELLGVLGKMGEYGANTTVLIGTDHGRGNMDEFTDHGGVEDARSVWLWVKGPRVKLADEQAMRDKDRTYRHVDIRGTIETLLGVSPTGGPGRQVLHEAVGQPIPEE